MNIGERLKDLRNQYGYSQAKVAAGIGIKQVTYQSYERGRAEVPFRILIALSNFYGFYSIDVLLGRATHIEHSVELLNKYRQSSPEKRKIIDYILSLKS